jgi:lipopolysaccharide export system protein LptA
VISFLHRCATSTARVVGAGASPAAITLGLALAAAPAWAERADRSQPISFVADSARVDEQRKVNVLTGNVEITKGTILIRANVVEVRQAGDGQSAVATGWPSRRAYFRQKRDGADEYVEGEAERLEYDGRNDSVKLINQAVMRRFRGNVLADEVIGQTISYDSGSEVFQVQGGNASGAPDGRVRGVITPREVPASAPASETPR